MFQLLQKIRLLPTFWRLWRETRGGVFIEYLLLCTIVGIGVIVGLAILKEALIGELTDLANAIDGLYPPFEPPTEPPGPEFPEP